jgi:hypothetical protein
LLRKLNVPITAIRITAVAIEALLPVLNKHRSRVGRGSRNSMLTKAMFRRCSRIAVTLLLTACCSCATSNQANRSPDCPPQYSFVYIDAVHGFHICLPAGIKRAVADYPKGSTLFTGFAVPGKTNLENKSLLIVSGDYDMLKGAKQLGRFTADNVTFERTKFEEGSAGHLTLHIIYTWKRKKLHFDFQLRSVNVNNFDPSNRPAEYDRDAQIKFTEQIISTFRPVD